MKHREDGFLSSQQIDHNGDQFDYIKELHTYLWRIIRAVRPGASGDMGDHIDHAVEVVESTDVLGSSRQDVGYTRDSDTVVCIDGHLYSMMTDEEAASHVWGTDKEPTPAA